jgi:hypothetical protein
MTSSSTEIRTSYLSNTNQTRCCWSPWLDCQLSVCLSVCLSVPVNMMDTDCPPPVTRQEYVHFDASLPSDVSAIIGYWTEAGIALGYGLDYRGSRVRFPAGAGNFSLHHCVQIGSGAHPASYPMGTRGSFRGGKAAGACSWPITSI